ncbi:MAG TPA: transaldolase family protein [Terriglobia bacterium]|nr:transaldolase family protein [Terriglobia bacterium]
MATGLRSLIESGTKLWLDSIDPEFLLRSRQYGATGATSNPIIVADIIKTGRYDREIREALERGRSDDQIAWELTDLLVRQAQEIFRPVYEATQGEDGYVSFELDPLIEDPALALPHAERVRRYVELGQRWSAGHANRLIKVPATPAGIESLAPLAAAGVPLNVTLLFTPRQYRAARTAVWAGAQQLASRERFKSVYSVFVSRVDVYTAQKVAALSPAAQGLVGIILAKRIWRENTEFWSQHRLPLRQEIVFASTGTKHPGDDPTKYVVALAGADIETNPPATNEAVERSGRTIQRAVDQMPPASVLEEVDRLVDLQPLEETLVREGVLKFAEPHKELLALIAQRRAALQSVPAGAMPRGS